MAARVLQGVFSIVLAAGCRAAEPAPPSGDVAGPSVGVNVRATDRPNVFRSGFVLASVSSVLVDGEALTAAEWSFDTESGLLTLEEPATEDEVTAIGVRAVPWTWTTNGPIEPGTVRMLLSDGPAVAGVDFEVDEDQGVIRMLRAELCTPEQRYFVIFDYLHETPRDGVTSGVYRVTSGSFGNHDDQAAIRRFLGLPPEEES